MFIDLPADAEDQRSTNAVFEHKKVHIRDIRGREADFDLDNQGFMIRRVQGVPLLERLDTQTIEGLYLPFVERLIREEVEGVDRVHFFDWRVGILFFFFFFFFFFFVSVFVLVHFFLCF